MYGHVDVIGCLVNKVTHMHSAQDLLHMIDCSACHVHVCHSTFPGTCYTIELGYLAHFIIKRTLCI